MAIINNNNSNNTNSSSTKYCGDEPPYVFEKGQTWDLDPETGEYILRD